MFQPSEPQLPATCGHCYHLKSNCKCEVKPVAACQACMEKDDRFPHTCTKGARTLEKRTAVRAGTEAELNKPIYTGGSSDYYKVTIKFPTNTFGLPYTAECNDIIEALGMNFAEGNAFKALWRRAAQRTLGLRKAGAKDDGLYDAEKIEFFGKRLVVQSKAVAK